MTAPAIRSQRPRLCRYDGFELVLDVETARASVEAGWPAVVLLRCLNGHSRREWPAAAPHRDRTSSVPCGVCGLALPRAKDGTFHGGRRVHRGQCTLIKGRYYRRFLVEHPGQVFFLEEQPWYRGVLAPRDPLPPLDPLAGSFGRGWLDGWARVHGYAVAEPAA